MYKIKEIESGKWVKIFGPKNSVAFISDVAEATEFWLDLPAVVKLYPDLGPLYEVGQFRKILNV